MAGFERDLLIERIRFLDETPLRWKILLSYLLFPMCFVVYGFTES